MKEDPKVVRPLKWQRLRSEQAGQLIRERAKDTRNVIIGDHAGLERIPERGITQLDLYEILRIGFVEGEPERSEKGDGWKVVVTKRMPGGREAGAVTIVIDPPSKYLFVKTVQWMDMNR